MEVHAIHQHILDAADEAGAVGLGQPTGHRQLLQTTWGGTEAEVTSVSRPNPPVTWRKILSASRQLILKISGVAL